MKAPSISLFFPCHNEEENVEKVTREALKIAQEITDDFEVIIVNDGSKDRTKEIAEALAKENPHVRVINHPVNRGYGGALQSGFKNATKELVFYTDGDGQFDFKDILRLLPLIEKCDIVSGYRANRQDSFMRKLNAFMWNKLVCLLFNLKVRDVDCAFKLYKRKIFDGMSLESNGALIDTEVLAKAQKRGFKILETPVSHYPRLYGKSSGANLSVIFKAFKELFQFYARLKNS